MSKERRNSRIEMNGVARVVAFFWDFYKVEEDCQPGDEFFQGWEEESFDEIVLEIMKISDDGIYEACLFMMLENDDIECVTSIRMNKRGKVVTVS
jgi:hypothetical protein